MTTLANLTTLRVGGPIANYVRVSTTDALVDAVAAADAAAQALGTVSARETLPTITHKFTHYTLHIAPLAVRIAAPVSPADWLAQEQALAKGLPAPVRRLIEKLRAAA